MHSAAFADLIDLGRLQKLMDLFHKVSGIPMSIVDTDGVVLLHSGWRSICTCFRRVQRLARQRCRESDLTICTDPENSEHRVYRCLNGLTNIAVPIFIEESHVATLFVAQFFFDDESIDWEFFKERAREYGFNEDDYLSAVQAVPVLSRQRVEDIKEYCYQFVCFLSTIGYNELRLRREYEEKLRAEEERKKLELHVLNAQKLDSLGILAGGIAHDFNNLLMGVLGHASLLSLKLNADPALKHHVDKIESAATRAAELSRQMLAYSGKGKFLIETLNLSQLVEEMLELLRSSTSKKSEFRCRLESQLPLVDGDVTQIRQVVMNLITNASDALRGREGIVTLDTKEIHIGANNGVIDFFGNEIPAGRYVVLEVGDNGSGMNEELRDKIFDPFFTTKNSGRGLGLSTVLGVVRGHHGAVQVFSELGQGTVFRIFFPALAHGVPRRPSPVEEQTESAGTPLAGTGTILVVDDEEGVRSATQATLEYAGYKVISVEDGRRAIEVFRENHGDFSAVLLDVTMPKMGGEEVFREIRRLRRDAKVILSTGYSAQDAAENLRGVSGFIQKPYRARDLLDKVKQVVQS
jgi:signal transduction histidine kinase